MKILMIEDNRQFAETFQYLLEGLDITVARTLSEGKSLLSLRRFGLIVVDLGLPDSHGLDTLRALRCYSTPKVVLTSTYDVAGEWASLGGIDYVCKTGDAATMVERILFNVSKIEKSRQPRFSDKVFTQIRACFEREHVGRLELTPA